MHSSAIWYSKLAMIMTMTMAKWVWLFFTRNIQKFCSWNYLQTICLVNSIRLNVIYKVYNSDGYITNDCLLFSSNECRHIVFPRCVIKHMIYRFVDTRVSTRFQLAPIAHRQPYPSVCQLAKLSIIHVHGVVSAWCTWWWAEYRSPTNTEVL